MCSSDLIRGRRGILILLLLRHVHVLLLVILIHPSLIEVIALPQTLGSCIIIHVCVNYPIDLFVSRLQVTATLDEGRSCGEVLGLG